MVRSLSTIAGIAAFAFAASAGTAAADYFGAHSDVTASVSQPKEGAAMSTFEGQLPTIEDERAQEAQVAEAPAADTTGSDQDKK